MKSIEELKQIFLGYLNTIKYSKGSIDSYNYCLSFYQKFIKENIIDDKFNFELNTILDFKKYLDEYKNKGISLKINTIYKIMNCLKIFFSYLQENNFLLINPFCKIDKIKHIKTLPKEIPDNSEISEIIRAININTKTGYRDIAIIELLYSTGIRKNELLKLSIYDIDLNNGFIRVSGKGNKDRIIPAGKTACQYMEKYLQYSRPKLLRKNPNEQILFISNLGQKMSNQLVRLIIKKYLSQTSIKKKITAHSFRHSCATAMLKGKANIRHVQEMLGHERLSTTQIYTQVLPLDLLEVHKKTHPSWTLFDEEKNENNT